MTSPASIPFLLLLLLPQGTPGGRVWSHRSGSYPPQIALGDRGGQLLAQTDADEILLFSSFDANPPAALWTAPGVLYDSRLLAATESDVYLFGQQRLDPPYFGGAVTLRKYRSGSSVPEWRYPFDRQFLVNVSYDISRDGETIVSYTTDENSMSMEIRVHDPASGAPSSTIVFPYVLDQGFSIDLSPDGSVAVGTRDGVCEIYDLATGQRLDTVLGRFHNRQSLSMDGRVLVTRQYTATDWWVRVFRREPGGYVPFFWVTTPYQEQPLDVVVSDDGSTVAATWSDSGTPKRSIVRAYDVPTRSMTMEHIDVAAEAIEAWNLAISADGSRFVVGVSYSAAGAVPELAVYARDANQPIRVHAERGPVADVEISPDGQRYAASRALEDRPLPYFPSAIELYEFGGEDFAVRGRPAIGETMTFELHGTPGSSAWLLRSLALAPTPIEILGVGTLRLDPATMTRVSMGVVPPSGVATHATVVSGDPTDVGRTFWFQGLTSGPRRLTDDFLQLTLVP